MIEKLEPEDLIDATDEADKTIVIPITHSAIEEPKRRGKYRRSLARALLDMATLSNGICEEISPLCVRNELIHRSTRRCQENRIPDASQFVRSSDDIAHQLPALFSRGGVEMDINSFHHNMRRMLR
jgi:hypothetical protein